MTKHAQFAVKLVKLVKMEILVLLVEIRTVKLADLMVVPNALLGSISTIKVIVQHVTRVVNLALKLNHATNARLDIST